MRNFKAIISGTGAVLVLLTPAAASACACGCGVFDVGDGTVMPVMSDSGFSIWARFATMDQNQNREQGHVASAADNSDKRIRTDFYTLGAEYMASRKWTVMAELPLYDRKFTTTGADTNGNPVTETVPLTDLGDLKVSVTYTGFSPDMSTGLTLGVKLPTGRSTSPADQYGALPYDRDTLPGTGSTDLLVGAYHAAHLAGAAAWFAQVNYEFAVATRDGYRPGNEFDTALGVTYDLGTSPRGLGLAPSVQMIGSLRAHDTGANADPQNSGYQRLLVAPGLRANLGRKLAVYADVEFPVAQYVNAAPAGSPTSGQLSAKTLFKLQVNYGF